MSTANLSSFGESLPTRDNRQSKDAGGCALPHRTSSCQHIWPDSAKVTHQGSAASGICVSPPTRRWPAPGVHCNDVHGKACLATITRFAVAHRSDACLGAHHRFECLDINDWCGFLITNRKRRSCSITLPNTGGQYHCPTVDVHHRTVSRGLTQAGVPSAKRARSPSILDVHPPMIIETLAWYLTLTATPHCHIAVERRHRGWCSHYRAPCPEAATQIAGRSSPALEKSAW